jgi:hypothetical protein
MRSESHRGRRNLGAALEVRSAPGYHHLPEAIDNIENHFESDSEEAFLGFPQNRLATHTEARITRNVQAGPGDALVIEGQYPPCNSCKGKMNAFSHETGAKTVNIWNEEGEVNVWQSRTKPGGCG